MDAARFDALTRLLSRRLSRRHAVTALAGVGVASRTDRDDAAARKHHKHKKPKIKRNRFGCVNVGDTCTSDAQCCSNICQGRMGKQTCRAHDTGGCLPGTQDAGCGGTNVKCTTSTGMPDGVCETTTGGAGYCANTGGCFACTTDKQCQDLCHDGRAACCICSGCTETGGTQCVSPANCSIP